MGSGTTAGTADALLSPGQRLGPYLIEAPLGAGGMGEVWRARDTRLGRAVALKVLPARFAASPERLERLHREARLLAALNHPHVATLYGLEESGPSPALVMELVEGASLDARLRRGPLPLAEALELACQIAAALEAAHDAGILHRDLKPANIRLTDKGQVKLLDFGLGKLLGPDAPAVDAGSASSTAEAPASPGSGVAGTAPYMSPEQARGESLDRRSDVWAFGCVLYEMLGGRRVFNGPTPSATIAAVLHEEPDWTRLPTATPPAVLTLLERCLRKHREQRLRDIGDARLELEELLARWRRGERQAPGREERSPYPGLRPFQEADAADFFGREREVQALWARIEKRRLLALIGPSGTGKSSFVRAGVVASRPAGWGTLVVTPGRAPLRALASALAPELAGSAEAVDLLLRFEEDEAVLAALRRWRARHAEALLVVDQFEELFTLSPPGVQARFAALLGALAEQADVHVLLALRDDFLMRCHAHQALAPVFEQLTPLGPLAGEPLRRALVEPAQRAGHRLEDEALVSQILAAVEGQRGALPLLAFAMAQLWEARDRVHKLFTRAAYERLGGVTGALAQHAESTLEHIGAEREPLVRELFRNLVTAQRTRAVIEREELLSVWPDREAAELALRELVGNRLVTTWEEPGPDGVPHHRVEIVHESLLESWPRLVRWQAQDQEGALLRDQLKQAAHLWHERGRSPDLLWTGAAYREFAVWRARYPGQLTALEEDFAQAMTRLATRRAKLRRAVVATVLVGLILFSGAVAISRRQALASAQRAQAAAVQAEASKLLALAEGRLPEDPTEALALTTASLELADTRQARVMAVRALAEAPPARELETGAKVRVPTFSPNGQWLAGAGHAALVHVWAQAGQRVAVLPGHELSPRGPNVGAWASEGGLVTGRDELATFVHVWSIPDGRKIRTIELGGESSWQVEGGRLLVETPAASSMPGQRVLRLRSWELPDGEARDHGRVDLTALGASTSVFAPGGMTWLYAKGRTVVARPLQPPGRDRVLLRHATELTLGRRLSPFARDASGTRVFFGPLEARGAPFEVVARPSTATGGVYAERSGRWLTNNPMFEAVVRLWDRGAWPAARPLVLRRRGSWYSSVEGLDPTGDWIVASTGDTSNLTFWPLRRRCPAVVDGYTPIVRPVAFSPDSRWLATSWRGGRLRVWPVGENPLRERPIPELSEQVLWGCLRFTPDSQQVFAVGDEGRAYIVPLDGSPARRLGQVPNQWLEAAAVSPSGRQVAAAFAYGGGPKTLRLWNLASGAERTFDLPTTGPAPDVVGQEAANGEYADSVTSLAFAGESTLYSAGGRGIHRWNLADGTRERVYAAAPGQPIIMSVESSGRTAILYAYALGSTRRCSPAERLDLQTGVSRVLSSFGDCVQGPVALDASGGLATVGDTDGLVRVGRLEGGEPHLLPGHKGAVAALAISPDLKWVASTGEDNTLRLWPMPDLDHPPLHSLPRAELIAKLKSLTNFRAVRDQASPEGWKIVLDRFPGWKDVPTW